jgi:outer membrane biosynthesis protein TonB
MKAILITIMALSLAAPAYAHGKPKGPPKNPPPIEQPDPTPDPEPEPEPEPTPEPEPQPEPEPTPEPGPDPRPTPPPAPPKKPVVVMGTYGGTPTGGQTVAYCVCCTVDGKTWWTVSPLASQARAKADCEGRVARYAAKGQALPDCPRGEANRARKWFAAN